jgi:hypothetical protein
LMIKGSDFNHLFYIIGAHFQCQFSVPVERISACVVIIAVC